MKFHHHWVTALFAVAFGSPSLANAAAVSGQGTWETTLQARDFDGNTATAEGYYDTVLNITWLKDASEGRAIVTTMDWFNSNAWATRLNMNGITGWRLPTVTPIDGTTAFGAEDYGFNLSAPGTLYAGSTASEMAHLFYNTLGNKGFCDPAAPSQLNHCPEQAGWGLSNTGPFSNLQSVTTYWSATTGPDPSNAWDFGFHDGLQGQSWKPNYRSAWAVHAGDVGVVPEAETWTMMLAGLGLVGLALRRRGLAIY